MRRFEEVTEGDDDRVKGEFQQERAKSDGKREKYRRKMIGRARLAVK